MGSLDAVIVSSWRRADYLSQCLQALHNARGIQDKLVWIFQNDRSDVGIDLAPVHSVIDAAKNLFENFKITRQNFGDGQEGYPGWVWTQADAFRQVYDSNASRMYFVSDDDVCTPDYFEWHDAVQADGDWFATCAWRNVMGQTKPFDLEAYYQISYPEEIGRGLGVSHKNLCIMLQTSPIWNHPVRMVAENWKIVMPYVQRIYNAGYRSSDLHSPDENHGPSTDMLPNPIPDYKWNKVRLA